MQRRTPHGREGGFSILEALVAFLVLSLGILTMSRLQTHLRLHADIARQRSEAVQLAQEEIEELRLFTTVAQTAGLRSYAGIDGGSRTVSRSDGYESNTAFRITRSILASADTAYKRVSVTVSWNDRTGAPQQVTLHTGIAGANPALSAALTVPATQEAFKSAFGRSAWIPLMAKDLGNGSSAFKPAEAGDAVFVFSNASGSITSSCSTGAARATKSLTTGDLGNCVATGGLLLSGQIRWSGSSTSDTTVSLALSGGPYPVAPMCVSEARKVVSYATPSGTRRDAVPIDATPASFGVASWVEMNDRFVAYHCVVTPLNGRWSGRLTLVPRGWNIGTSANDYKVCRYSSDQDANGAIDNNGEHPADYVDVDSPLRQQNYLVVEGDQPCPGMNTVQHQP